MGLCKIPGISWEPSKHGWEGGITSTWFEERIRNDAYVHYSEFGDGFRC